MFSTIKRIGVIAALALSAMLIEYRKIEAAENIAKMQAENDKATFVPYEALGSTGLSNRVFQR